MNIHNKINAKGNFHRWFGFMRGSRMIRERIKSNYEGVPIQKLGYSQDGKTNHREPGEVYEGDGIFAKNH